MRTKKQKAAAKALSVGLNEEPQPKPEDALMEVRAYKYKGKLYETVDDALSDQGSTILLDTIGEHTFNGEFETIAWIDSLRKDEQKRLLIANFIKNLKPL